MAGKVIQNDFTVDIAAESQTILDMLDTNTRDLLLLHYISQEALKKQDEIRKNYKDIARFLPNSFPQKLYERLVKKVMTFNNASNQVVEQVAVAAKSTKAKAKAQ